MKDFITEQLLQLKEYIASGGGVLALITGYLYGMSSFNLSLLVLLVIICLDFLSGIMASYSLWKKDGKPKIKNGYLYSSKRFRDTVDKGKSYGITILVTWLLAWVTVRNPEISLFGMQAKTIPEYVTIVLIAIETYSILENLKKSGVDIIGGVQKVAKKGWELFNNVKKGEFKQDERTD